jgi:23S rRNA (cytidine1920-2'-O)/16S rRNA (cytidine1409-2'-O)-methyltransferase
LRLDHLLVQRGLFASREQARRAVMAGIVQVDGRRMDKPGTPVGEDATVSVLGTKEPFVSRAGRKLADGLDHFGVDPAGRVCLDVGASTGGFTDCLLQRGAEAVVALDVAYGELHWSLRQDPRVTAIERRNARELERAQLPFAPDLIVADLSFISLTKVLPAVLACAASRFDCLALVKPQFEVGRELVGRGGVVRSPDDRRAALVKVAAHARETIGVEVLGFVSSGLPGPAGNLESFVWLAESGREGAVEDLEGAARKAEP